MAVKINYDEMAFADLVKHFTEIDKASRETAKLIKAVPKQAVIKSPQDQNLEALLVEVNKRIEEAYNEGYRKGYDDGYAEGYDDHY